MLQQGRLAMGPIKQNLTCRALLTALSLIHSSLIASAQQSTGVEKGRAISQPGRLALVPCDIAGIKGKGRCGSSNAMLFAFFPERRRGAVDIEGDNTIVLKPEGGVEWRVVLDPQTSLPKT